VNALVSSSGRFALTTDGRLWTARGHAAYSFWIRYLEVYDLVRLLVRAVERPRPPEGWQEVTGPGIEAIPLPDFHTPSEFVRTFRDMRRIVRSAVDEAEAIHLRPPCLIGGIFWRTLDSGRPYGVEVIGDPYDLFAPGAFPEKMRPLYRTWFSRRLRLQCARATAAAYVTERGLQMRYPPAPGAFVSYFSDVDLEEDAFVTSPRKTFEKKGPTTLIMVGSLEQLYKGPNILVEAVALALRRGADVQLVLAGEGKRRQDLERQVENLGIKDRVEFLGQVPAGHGVRKHLDAADVFVLPSFQEGLPRAMIEAMARGLPCLGSAVGGIPELLSPQDLVPPGDVLALADQIYEVTGDPGRMAQMSIRNLDKASNYREQSLRERRVHFYQQVKEQTESWLQTR
jgi:glycosyltransferase involved in cell wall biosynthesis